VRFCPVPPTYPRAEVEPARGWQWRSWQVEMGNTQIHGSNALPMKLEPDSENPLHPCESDARIQLKPAGQFLVPSRLANVT